MGVGRGGVQCGPAIGSLLGMPTADRQQADGHVYQQGWNGDGKILSGDRCERRISYIQEWRYIGPK